MTGDVEQAREAIRRCRELRESGNKETVLRGEFHSRLRLMFPEPRDQDWINHYGEGAESGTKVGQADGGVANRFIDNLIGSTTIEYESDLRMATRRDRGLEQVREHIAGLVRGGIPVSRVRGVLSDTVEWLAYDADLATGSVPDACTMDEIELSQVDRLDLISDDEPSATLLIAFVRKHLAREQSRPLRASLLTSDLGLNSAPYGRTVDSLLGLVAHGRAANPAITLATDLWSEFVDHLEREVGEFRIEAYVDELYLCILTRLLSANVLSGHAISSNDVELKAILDGSHFRDRHRLENMVEQDYFGWMFDPSSIDGLVPAARQIQQDLYAYDFSYRPEEDLFGRLMAQLAGRSKRRLLGQEWTPAWLAHQLVSRCLDNIPEGEHPRIIDMCCGSGTILAEVIKGTRNRSKDPVGIDALHGVVTGFDIDPLAVSLAKTTWVITLADEIRAATGPIIIPVYHADSLFSVTPITAALPLFGKEDTIPVSLDEMTIDLPGALVQPEYRELFDRIIDWAHDEAHDARKEGSTGHLTKQRTEQFLSGAADAVGITLSVEFRKTLLPSVFAMARRMAELAVAGRNGIWAFILRNTYRPGLLAGQFNGLVSNPPWLAMSRLGDNPYREVLTRMARHYGIRPPGQSFPHLELATTHLLHAVDRYLATDAAVACLVPGTVLNGRHHEPFRQRRFLTTSRPIAFEIDEVWTVEPGTFKYPGAAVVGRKRASPTGLADREVVGILASQDGLRDTAFSTRAIGSERTAWVLEQDGLPTTVHTDAMIPQQGADLMPRRAVCIEIVDEGGAEYRVDTPSQATPHWFAVKAAKQLRDERFPGHVASRFIHRMAQSKNLLPFVLDAHFAPIAIPAIRGSDGKLKILNEAEIRAMGLIHTARRFRTINERLLQSGRGGTLQHRIDERSKLTTQKMPRHGHLVLAGAGGKHVCAACVPIPESGDLVVDQTLYWRIVSNEDEASYCVGMLNSRAMTEAISPFNPKGAGGERHVHSLPYRLMPPFDHGHEDHVQIATLAQEIATFAEELVAKDPELRNPNRALAARRTRLRNRLQTTGEFGHLESLCARLLGTTAIGEWLGEGQDEGSSPDRVG